MGLAFHSEKTLQLLWQIVEQWYIPEIAPLHQIQAFFVLLLFPDIAQAEAQRIRQTSSKINSCDLFTDNPYKVALLQVKCYKFPSL